MLSKLDKSIISVISKDIPLAAEPFREMAEAIGVDEAVLLKRIRSYKKTGLMRKFTAVLNHRKLGFTHNAMVVWDIPEKMVERAAGIMASFDEVSHCYEREIKDDWNFNLYCMVHGRSKFGCINIVKKIANKIGHVVQYSILFSTREEKKTGANYFTVKVNSK
ncbi:MAG: Lrp/AsnC family transcriptional regulator [Candidatus Omnitrophica bacterium]|nr:Lrp/AsnC family transcriptional regulator [Candidatus Omnitrophota bacterium]